MGFWKAVRLMGKEKIADGTGDGLISLVGEVKIVPSDIFLRPGMKDRFEINQRNPPLPRNSLKLSH